MFRHGAITSLKNALYHAAKVATEEHVAAHGPTGSAMVLASRAQQAEAWLDSTHTLRKARAVPSFGKTDAEAYRRGLDAGRGINIGRDDRAMGGGSRALPERAG